MSLFVSLFESWNTRRLTGGHGYLHGIYMFMYIYREYAIIHFISFMAYRYSVLTKFYNMYMFYCSYNFIIYFNDYIIIILQNIDKQYAFNT